MNKLDTDGDGQLSFDEFKVLFENADRRKKDCDKKSQETLFRCQSEKVRYQDKELKRQEIIFDRVNGSAHLTDRDVKRSFGTIYLIINPKVKGLKCTGCLELQKKCLFKISKFSQTSVHTIKSNFTKVNMYMHTA